MTTRLTHEQVIALLKDAPVHRFGATELDDIHRKRDERHRYTHYQAYVVFHPGVRGGPSHHTLNVTFVGQLVPDMYDIEKDWLLAAQPHLNAGAR
jgi:hypothetical protein